MKLRRIKCYCSKIFITSDHRRKYCEECNLKNDRHITRTIRRENHDVNFIGVDGEGVLRPNGIHEYILLSVGNESLHGQNGERLTFEIIAEFLWQCFLDSRDSIFVGFFLGYDFTCWLKDLPENRARMLLTTEGQAKRSRTKSGENRVPFPVEYHGWEFDLLGMKRFKLRAKGSKPWMYICDTGAFFQTSFLNVINPSNWPDGAIVTDEEYELIEEGKKDRGAIVPYGSPVPDDMIRYNVLENDVLGRLMDRYNKGLVAIGINLNKRQWFGPGQAAQEWMNNVKVPTREEHLILDRSLLESGRASYYGGWFEIFAHGHVPGISYMYDINSAYPYIMSELPCLLHGEWQHESFNSNNDIKYNNNAAFCLYYATVTGTDKYIGAAPHRTSKGRILRPLRTKGWYWHHELSAARHAGLIDTIEVEYGFRYTPCDCRNPFEGLAELYQDRIRLGKNTPEGKARKLVYNSAYGKCAQSIGVAKYANPIYASLITAGCRKMILDAIATHPDKSDSVLMVATDGIAFKTPHPNLDLSNDDLGKWSESESTNLTLFMPGMYWDDKTRSRIQAGDQPSLRSRGVSAKALASQIKELDRLFLSTPFPSIRLYTNFSMVSPIQALARGKWHTAGLVTLDETRDIDSNPAQKRDTSMLNQESGICRTTPYPTGPTLESTPYDKRFGMEMAELKELDGISPDGDIMMLLAEALGLR